MKTLRLPIEIKTKEAIRDKDYLPYVDCYLLDESTELKNSHQRQAVIVCPGGAYRFKSDREAEPIAMRFLAEGMQAFVLQYSVAPATFPCAMEELALTVKTVRERAAEWNIDPDQIYICGFSAGGHLCASLGTMWNKSFFKQKMEWLHETDAAAWRPNGMILGYPVINAGEFTHEESRKLLLGGNITEETIHRVSLEEQVDDQTIPCFLWHTTLDNVVPAENSLLFAIRLQQYHISYEMHLYEEGDHGLALCNKVTQDLASQVVPDNANWMEMAVNWLHRR